MIGYYYCSLSTFLNILKSKQIYLSDPLKMNDNLEIKWYLDRLNDEKSNENEFESVFNMMKMRSNIDFTFEELVKCLNSKGQMSIYICCFSKESDILSQWRAYAEGGKGVSIGFDLEKLKIVDSHGAFQEKWKSIELKHDFRVIESNNITEFVKLDFDPDSIEEICIGPKCLLSKNDIKHILKKLLGVEKDVIESKSSYR
ncbi:DUF2971 domain-containing protein [Clostridium sp. MT-14]|uniref:DUF2971 domain-containing protein n=1 Tax=Clostridium aromativorans TaxID=2836848 RepID=A0ABS8N9D9_9CLOT|nr:DUF2971 domain-containing protein [Clostridium aromativorans]MCC9296426.1 DUF2971 domain-containing protein [Clostridium aromativorans]